MQFRILPTIESPEDVKKLTDAQLSLLCDEIREYLIEVISKNGGHLSSNLGVVELTVALHRVFNSPKDEIIFDVGHQAYTHKLLTGRYGRFDSIRKKDGLSGFPKPSESEHDPIIAGHGSAALSAALGIARAKKLNGDDGKVVVVIGDGAFAGGMVYEAINNIDYDCGNLLVILNDNSMSISKSVGSLSKYLMKLRTQKKYNLIKKTVKSGLEHVPIIGFNLISATDKYKKNLRRKLYNGTLFEELGFNYVGPVDGHSIDTLVELLKNIKQLDEPILFHIKTQKGRGYNLAESNPGMYHGVSGFVPEIDNPDIARDNSFSNVFGLTLLEAAQTRDDLCAVTAAMKYATGLNHFAKEHYDRFFDVGIAEEHAVTFASGLAKGGFKPVVAIYSTFLQRAYDQIIHDILLNHADVLFAVDRAGIVGEDGETHQGIFDAAFLSEFDGLPLWSPCNYSELHETLLRLIEDRGPAAIRYPRGSEDRRLSHYKYTGDTFDLFENSNTKHTLFVTYGRLTADVLEASDNLKKEYCRFCDVLKLNRISPIDEKAVAAAMRYGVIVFAEEGIENGSIAQHFAAMLLQAGYKGRFTIRALKSQQIRQMSVSQAFEEYKLNAKHLTNLMLSVSDNEKED